MKIKKMYVLVQLKQSQPYFYDVNEGVLSFMAIKLKWNKFQYGDIFMYLHININPLSLEQF